MAVRPGIPYRTMNEITLGVERASEESHAWFGGRLLKVASVLASLGSSAAQAARQAGVAPHGEI